MKNTLNKTFADFVVDDGRLRYLKAQKDEKIRICCEE